MDATQFSQMLEAFNKAQQNLLRLISTNTNNQQQQQGSQPFQMLLPPFEHFDATKENFRLYRQRFENYLTMKGVFTNKVLCHQMLINSIGSVHFKLIVSLIAPKSLNEVEYKDIIEKLEAHLCPKRNILVSQHRFLSTYQNEGQTIAEYVALLKRDINECNFLSSCNCKADISNIFLRAQFIRGIFDNTIREQILQSEETDFDKIVQKSLSLEASKIDSREINAKHSTSDVNKIVSRKQNRGRSHSSSRHSKPQARAKSKVNYKELGIDNLCIRCGRDNHKTKQCRTNAKNLKCNSCGKRGHVQQVCITTLMKSTKNANVKSEDTEESIHQIYGINRIIDIFSNQHSYSDVDKYYVTVELNGRKQQFEVDSGVGFTLIPRNQFNQLQINEQLQPSSVAFRSYTKNIIVPDGKVKVRVKFNNSISDEEMYVVPDEYDALLGRVWIRHLNINLQQVDKHRVHNINKVNAQNHNSISDIINEFPEVFEERVGCVPEIEITLQLRKGSKPVFYKEREVPYALRDSVEKELEELEASGIISKCERSDWGSPLVIVPKPDGKVRLCVDYKPGVNPQLVAANYPIRRIDEILNSLKGSKYFCRLDLYKAYLHIRVNPESTPSEFNRIIEQLLSGLNKTMSYFDDILVHGSTEAECKQNLVECLKRLKKYDLHLNKSKCSFLKTRVEYLGHVVQFNQISKSPSKVETIVNMARPKTVDDVRRFLGMLVTDNRPLTRIFHQHNKMPAITSARLLRYAEFLSSFNYEVIYKKGSENTNADCLSRATQIPGNHCTDKVINEEINELCLLSIFEISSEYINSEILASETAKDPELSNILTNMMNGNDEGTYMLNNGIIFKGQRVVIPKSLQQNVLQELHRTHPGVTKMKQLARRYCIWKGIDRDIERTVRSCEPCVQVQNKPAKAPLHHWEEPKENWERIHIDYAGPFQDNHFLVVVDAKSRWAEFRVIRDAPTTQSTINLLSDIFATHGYPSIMVSDNATIFTSAHFKSYCSKNGIYQKLIAPGHPSTNGLAERNVQTLKRKLKAMSTEPGPLRQKVNDILQIYRATPLSNGMSPAELYLKRRIRIRLDALKPITHNKVTDSIPGVRHISEGERVQALYTQNSKTIWKTGTVQRKLGQLHYIIKLDDGYTLKRHIDQLKVTKVQQRKVRFAQDVPDIGNTRGSTSNTISDPADQQNHRNSQYNFQQVETGSQSNSESNDTESQRHTETLPRTPEQPTQSSTAQNPEQSSQRPARIRNKPAHLRDYDLT
ncbi:uncharacterized protein K02A2.6-like [Rhagoletis pomonella]|uniref:uncharacterized protein K02A2.6-like n=1 Tax=Rhagoletis pomonella TaxID=28610 RepID=UPI00178171CE|nr:uncharacterized protein K02A2.6-like [Rhagoletis pomonella]